jgi:hypothetical protein
MFGGAVHTDPARFPQSHEGALITLIFYGIAVTIVVLNCIKLYVASNATVGEGSGIVVSIATQHVKFNGTTRSPVYMMFMALHTQASLNDFKAHRR